MNILESIEAENLILFKKTRFNFQPGVTCIRGQNLDSARDSANACGKTLLFNTVPNMLMHTPPLAEKKNEANKFLPPKSKVVQTYKIGKQEVVLTQALKGKSVHYDINIDGKPLQSRTATQMREAVTSLMPMSDAVFYSTVMVSPLRPPLLWLGSSAKRYDFFEEIADIGYYDKKAAQISKKISEIRIQEKVMVPWEQELQDLAQIYTGDEQIADLERHIKMLEETQDKEFKRTKKLRDTITQLRVLDAAPEGFPGKFVTAEQFFAAFKKEKEKVKELAGLGNDMFMHVAALEERAKQYPKYEKWKKQVAAFKSKYTEKEIRKRLKKRQELNEKLEDALETYREFQDDIRLYVKHKLHKVSGPNPTNKQVKEVREQIAAGKAHNKLTREYHETGKCPVCLRKAEKGAKGGTHEVKSLEAQLEKMLLLQTKYKVEAPYVQECLQLIKRKDEIVAATKAELAEMTKLEKHELLKANRPKKCKPVDPKLLKESRNNLKEIRRDFEKARKKFRKMDGLREYFRIVHSAFGDNAKIPELMAKLKRAQRKYNKVADVAHQKSDSLISLKSELLSIKRAKRSYEKLNAKCKKAKKVVQELSDWKILHEAFGATGMRVQHLQSFVSGYIKYMNNLAPLLFSEDVKFSADLHGRNFNLNVIRHGKSSDVRYLSGAQARFFMILSAVALRKMLPSNKTFNFIVFDEIDAGISTGELVKLTTVFMEYLQEEIPCIIVITPKSAAEFSIDGAVDKFFIRKGGETTIQNKEAANNNEPQKKRKAA
jgi:vacuolar-type H+-ATPase subunit I/STV1